MKISKKYLKEGDIRDSLTVIYTQPQVLKSLLPDNIDEKLITKTKIINWVQLGVKLVTKSS